MNGNFFRVTYSFKTTSPFLVTRYFGNVSKIIFIALTSTESGRQIDLRVLYEPFIVNTVIYANTLLESSGVGSLRSQQRGGGAILRGPLSFISKLHTPTWTFAKKHANYDAM